MEVFVGRTLAACVHPAAAWRRRSLVVRLQVVGGYLLAGYVLALVGLLLLGPTAALFPR